jgi:hypothetical protein
MSGAGGGERFLKASLRQSGRAFGLAVYGTRERVPFRIFGIGVAVSSAYFDSGPPFRRSAVRFIGTRECVPFRVGDVY